MTDRWVVDNIQIDSIDFSQDNMEVKCGISIYNGCKDLNGESQFEDNIDLHLM